MMLSRTGWGETSLPVAFQTVGGRRAPWGCAAGAPYRGTASPPPTCMCVCVSCLQGWTRQVDCPTCWCLLTVYLLYYRKAPSRMLFHTFFYFLRA